MYALDHWIRWEVCEPYSSCPTAFQEVQLKGDGRGGGKGDAWGDDKDKGKGLTLTNYYCWQIRYPGYPCSAVTCWLAWSRGWGGVPFFNEEANRFPMLASATREMLETDSPGGLQLIL